MNNGKKMEDFQTFFIFFFGYFGILISAYDKTIKELR